MADIGNDTKLVLAELIAFLVPDGMSRQERVALAKKAGISYETLRSNMRRRTLNAETLIRLLLARGVEPRHLRELPQGNHKELSKGECDWLLLGRELTELERTECINLIRHVRSRWKCTPL